MSSFIDHSRQPTPAANAPIAGLAADAYHDMVLVTGRLLARGAVRLLAAMQASREKHAQQIADTYRRD